MHGDGAVMIIHFRPLEIWVDLGAVGSGFSHAQPFGRDVEHAKSLPFSILNDLPFGWRRTNDASARVM
jgi:hypothetical protein